MNDKARIRLDLRKLQDYGSQGGVLWSDMYVHVISHSIQARMKAKIPYRKQVGVILVRVLVVQSSPAQSSKYSMPFLTRGYAKRRNGFLLGLRYANVSLAHSGVESS